VPMQAEKIRKRALHEPAVWCPGFSRSGPPEGGTPNKSRHTVRFRVPMHGKKAEEALHEPEGRACQSPARRLCIAKPRRARSDAPYRFVVPMHAEKSRKGAFHEPDAETREIRSSRELRVENWKLRISPLAKASFGVADRNYSSMDNSRCSIFDSQS